MAGLFAAILLRSRGWDPHVYERASEALANRGAGIVTHNVLYDAVRAAGIELRDEMGVPSLGRVVFDASGAVIGKLDMPQIMTSWGLIYRFLRAQIPDSHYHHGHTLVGLDTHGERVHAAFDNGARAAGDWLIGADGSRSTVRRLVAPEVRFDYCGYFVWRGLFDETRIDPAVLTQVANQLALNMAPGGHWLG
ncbi:MAG: FAD-dependent oxidoreductase, partial [Gammaproteobacteria bacterium]